MKKIGGIVYIGVFVLVCRVAAGATWYVDGSVSETGNGQSWETAFQTIQEGVDAAVSGDTVVVAEGKYVENLVYPATALDAETIFEGNFDAYTNLYTSEDVVNDGWEVVNGGGDPNGAWRLWSTTGEYLREQDPNLAGMSQNYMISDSDLAPDVTVSEELITPMIDCVGWAGVRLQFNKNYRVYSGHPDHMQFAQAAVRVLNEATGVWGDWENILHYDVTMVDDTNSEPEDLNVSWLADGKKVQFRWYFYEAEFDYWFAVDDIRVTGQPMQAKNITLRSTNPLDPDVVANTVIDGGGEGSVVRLSGWENESCILEGFTIRNGGRGQEPRSYGGGVCGGDPYMGFRAHATIRNNVIIGNDTDRGGGLANCDGAILSNTISQNDAGRGGGLIYCNGRIENNLITGNSSGGEGAAGLYHCDGLIRNNIITGNMAYDEGAGGLEGCGGPIQNNVISGNWSSDYTGGLSGCHGIIENNIITGNSSSGEGAGGLSWCNGTIRNNIIAGNSADEDGGGLAGCGGTIENNTIVNNRASESGGGLYRCEGTILNCIIWGNSAPRGNQLFESSEPTYSCVQCGGTGGGNVASYPYLVDPEGGDYHLLSWSPCIDMGDPSSDFLNEPVPNGGRINMGTYGNTAEAASKSADTDGDNLPDDWELAWFSNLDMDGDDDPDGDGIPNASEYRHGWNPTGAAGAQVENLTKGLSYETIQDALCESEDGDEIVVPPGVYEENISFEGKNVVLRSTYPTDASVIATTIIDGGQRGPVVAFLGTEDSTCVLAGFTIRNGKAGYGGGILGGTTNSPTQATIRNNVITGNVATGEGGGLYCCSGLLQNNTVFRNRSWYGGGLSRCVEGTIRDCIIWGNIAATGEQLLYSVEPTYCCIEYWSGGGEGNVTDDPHFVDAEAGDYRLESWSRCVDAGDPSSDFSNEPEPSGGRVNMGAYGNTTEAACKSTDTDEDGLPDDWEMYWLASLETDQEGDPDGDSIPNARELLYGWDPGTAAENLVENVTQGEWYEAIQAALWESESGDEIAVYPGVYRENVWFMGKNVVLRSTDPLEAGVVAETIIDAGGFGSVVTFSGGEDSTCVLSGFTIRNGRAVNGGGICGVLSQATIENNVVTGNEASGEYGRGGGLYQCNGTIRNNRINENAATHGGGGVWMCDGLIQNNVIRDNTASVGAGLDRCDGVVENNIIAGNEAVEGGGGLYNCDGYIRSNLIVGNSASGGYGGGLFSCRNVMDNTICANSATYAGGLYACSGTTINCVIWGNTATEGPQAYDRTDPTYSCIQDWTGGGEGNIAGDPLFIDAGGGDYRLQEDSPCIDAGMNADWMAGAVDLDGEPRVMLGGYSRTVDMGAYEYRFPFYIAGIARTTEGRIQLTWESRPGTTYKITACLDLLSDFWIDLATIPSQGATTTWTDPALPMAGKLFYRIEIP